MWVIYAILGGLALSRFYIVSRELRSRYGFEPLVMAMGVILLPFAFMGFGEIFRSYGFYAVASGFVYGLSLAVFYVGLGYLSVLVIAIVAMTIPAVVAVLGWLLLDGSMSALQIFGFAAVIAGAGVASIVRSQKKSTTKGILIMLVSVVMTSAYNIMAKHVKIETNIDAWDLFLLIRLGVMFAVAALLITPMRKRMLALFSLDWKTQRRFYVNELYFVAFAFFFIAAMASQKSIDNVGLVSVTYFGTQQVVLFVHAIYGGNEERLGRKSVGAILAFSGLVLLVT